MQGRDGKPSPPSGDVRWREARETMRRLGDSPNALIETLHAVQNAFGCITPEAMRFIAKSLRLPLSKVYGVVTFYHLFTLLPRGRHSCVICTGTACHVRGAPAVLEALKKARGIAEGETSADGGLTLTTARCLGTCGRAPVGVFDGEILGNLTDASTIGRVEAWEAK